LALFQPPTIARTLWELSELYQALGTRRHVCIVTLCLVQQRKLNIRFVVLSVVCCLAGKYDQAEEVIKRALIIKQNTPGQSVADIAEVPPGPSSSLFQKQ
jgi:hypothetical protein